MVGYRICPKRRNQVTSEDYRMLVRMCDAIVEIQTDWFAQIDNFTSIRPFRL